MEVKVLQKALQVLPPSFPPSLTHSLSPSLLPASPALFLTHFIHPLSSVARAVARALTEVSSPTRME
eukprot:2961651-Rhodomonas_salina.1